MYSILCALVVIGVITHLSFTRYKAGENNEQLNIRMVKSTIYKTNRLACIVFSNVVMTCQLNRYFPVIRDYGCYRDYRLPRLFCET